MALNDEQEKTLKAELDAEKAKGKKLADDLAAASKTKEEKDKEEADKKAKEEEDAKKEEDLSGKARKQKQSEEETKNETKRIESALKFNLGVSEFVKGNKDVLPTEIPEILKLAEKENYDSALEKANALRAVFVKTFFGVQSNLDALTVSQKAKLEDFLKLTKSGREEKAESIYENVFEPALETLKKIKKAEEVGKSRSGFTDGSTTEQAYKERLMKSSKKTHMGEKGE